MKTEKPFKDVKPGDRFEFSAPLFSTEAVKTELTTTYVGGVKHVSNITITKIPSQSVLKRKPGDHEWLPDDEIVRIEDSAVSLELSAGSA